MSSERMEIHDFRLTALLRLGDLNMRETANQYKKMTLGEYYALLSQFLAMAPDVFVALKDFAADDYGNRDWKIIREIIALFQRINCHKFTNDLNAIRNAHGKGDHKSASYHADKMKQGFNDFYSEIFSAKKAKNSSADPNEPSHDSTLQECLETLAGNGAEHKPVVMTVDDSPVILETVSAVLSAEYKVFKLQKSTMLEKVLKQVIPDLFLLDYQMPELNGFELIPIIRGFDECINTPIIFLTSEGTVDNITAAIALGACDFIVKPFLPDQLKTKVARHIKRAKRLR